MYRNINIYTLVKQTIGCILPSGQYSEDARRKGNLREHITLTEDMLVDLVKVYLDGRDEPEKHVKKLSDKAKAALVDFKDIIEEAEI